MQEREEVVSRSYPDGKCPDGCQVVLSDRRDAELESWRRQALEENAAADVLRDEVSRLKMRVGEVDSHSATSIGTIMRRGDAERNDDLVDELRMSLSVGCAIRKRFKKQLWRIVTGMEWEERPKARRDTGCIRCAHFKSNGQNKSSSCGLLEADNPEKCHA